MPDSGSRPPVTEAELHGFVDGDLEPGRREAVRNFLANSPADAARVQAWRRQNETIRAAFAAVENEPIHLSWPAVPPTENSETGGCGASKLDQAVASLQSWRRWAASFIALAFLAGALLATGGRYALDRLSRSDDTSATVSGPTSRSDEALVTRTISALLAFAPPPNAKDAAARLAPKGAAARRGEATALILPNLSARGLKLAGVRVMPSELGEMLCMFYAKSETVDAALCVERSDDSSDTVTRKSGKFPSAAVYWRQNGADYALAGSLTEAELQKLAEEIRAEVEAFN